MPYSTQIYVVWGVLCEGRTEWTKVIQVWATSKIRFKWFKLANHEKGLRVGWKQNVQIHPADTR